jgi:hypothetical protein
MPDLERFLEFITHPTVLALLCAFFLDAAMLLLVLDHGPEEGAGKLSALLLSLTLLNIWGIKRLIDDTVEAEGT